tara:strand:+ start:241 stop:486 length:246 start_codon:yes stop_codon:yes gene_type:complete
MKISYYNSILPQTKEQNGFPLNHADLKIDQKSFIEAIYNSKELQLRKEEIMELIQELQNSVPEHIELGEIIEEINSLLEDL